MAFDYSSKVAYEDIIVFLIQDGTGEFYKNLAKDMIDVVKQYGVRVTTDVNDLIKYKDCMVKHAIVIAGTEDPVEVTNKYLYLLKEVNTMSLGVTYDNETQMLSKKDAIESLKIAHDFKINYLRPDMVLNNGECVISEEKIIDNAVCDTVRIKYVPRKDETFKVDLSPEYKDYFTKISEIYTNEKLYHRTPNDGFFAVRYKHGFYITATKTYKSPLDLARVSFVHSYDEAKNELHYSGQFLPSSDVVEASLVFRENPSITAIVHTHASDKLTRNPEFSHKIKVGRESYGIPELGMKINKIINNFYDDFIILQEHGEVFAIQGDVSNAADKMEEILAKATHGELVG